MSFLDEELKISGNICEFSGCSLAVSVRPTLYLSPPIDNIESYDVCHSCSVLNCVLNSGSGRRGEGGSYTYALHFPGQHHSF